MSINTSTLRPGLLVSLKTSCRGNVSYLKVDLEEGRDDNGAARAKWETTRTIADPAEHEAARKAQSKASSLIRSVCTHTAFGLLCPHADADKLERAIADARAVVDEFNANAKLSRVHVYVIAGQVAADDVEAVKAINSEVRSLLEDMADGLKNADAKAIRRAAQQAKDLGSMLSPEAEARVRIAVDTARSAARRIVKAGEAAAVEIDNSAIRKVTEQRTAFLDLSDERDIGEAMPVAGRAVEFDMEGTR